MAHEIEEIQHGATAPDRAIPNFMTERGCLDVKATKIFVKLRGLCLACALCLLCAAGFSCALSPQEVAAADIEGTGKQLQTDTPTQSTGKNTNTYWCNLSGTALAMTDPALMETPDLTREINDFLYFYATVDEMHDYYALVTPTVDMADPREIFPSCAQELRKHSEQYIIPCTAYVNQIEISVGDTVKCQFRQRDARVTEEYGATPVLTTCSLKNYAPENAGQQGQMYFAHWQKLTGANMFRIVLPDLYDTDKNINPYFLAEVTETTEDYLVVKPRADISLKNAEFVSYSAELLKHSESYIIPRALMMDSHYLTDEDATVGDLVKITFNSLQVYRDTVYGETPVMKIVFYFTPLSEDDINTVS